MSVDWRLGGIMLGLVFFLALMLVKPIGVSTQFVIADGVIADALNNEVIVQNAEGVWTSSNPYFARYASNIANPLNYGFVFVIAMAIGAALSSGLRRGVAATEKTVPAIWRANFGSGAMGRMAIAFAGGFIVLFGARMAGGCTSGHMMAGMSQTAVSGFLFTLGVFATAIPTAMMMYRKEG
ncbi:MAG: YeeE/YedE family protein [Pararhodobacter sp.]|nr:YeeE/YedE family protein [Pararhodobacter sp.]